MRRPILLLVAATVAGTTITAHAAPKTVCNVVTDATGDSSYSPLVGQPGAPGDAGDDITSADIASDGKVVTGVVRVAKLSVPNPAAPLGQAFFMKFNVKGAPEILFLSARTYPQGTQFVYGYTGVDPTSGINTSYTLGTATGVVDTAKNEVRISAPATAWKDAKAVITKGKTLNNLLADTWRMAGQGVVPSQTVGGQRVPLGGFLLPFDDATGKSYVVGTKSCVAHVK